MTIRILEDGVAHLAEYAHVSIGFWVAEIFDDDAVAALARGDPAAATPLETPYWKDYDEHAGNRPSDWPARFEVSRWTILSATHDGRRVGGATIIHEDPQIELLGGSRDVALLWDLRVSPTMRGHGVGSALLRAAEDAMRRRGAAALRVETQQINVPACRLYARHGFALERVVRGAYAGLPDEMQLLWRKEIGKAK